MRMMTIPNEFKWSEISLEKLNEMNSEEKNIFKK